MTDKTQHVTPEEARKMLGLDPAPKRSSKMNAQRTESKSGIIHASKKESRYADTLDLLQREGHILGHMQQVSIPLAPGAKNRYRLDELVIYRRLENGHYEVSFEDPTGFKTDKKKLNISMMLSSYGVEVECK